MSIYIDPDDIDIDRGVVVENIMEFILEPIWRKSKKIKEEYIKQSNKNKKIHGRISVV